MRNLYITLATLFITVLVSSCQKSPVNGDLDGQWQVMSVTPEATETIINDRMYYCFSLHTCQLSIYGVGIWTAGNISFDGSTLVIDLPNANSEESVKKLKQYGIYNNPVTFTIEHLDNKKLILKDGETVVTLRKF